MSKKSAEDRTRVRLRHHTELIRVVYRDGAPPTPESEPGETVISCPHFIPGEQEKLLEISQEMDGTLEGLTATFRLDLVDGELLIRSWRYEPSEPMSLTDASSRKVMRELRHGDLVSIVERCLVNMNALDGVIGAEVLPYLKAARAHKQARPGRSGTPDLYRAEVAQKRVGAERRWPRNAIKMMVEEWPDDFVSESAANAKVNRARRKGMLEGRGKTLRLTDKAKALLEGTPS